MSFTRKWGLYVCIFADLLQAGGSVWSHRLNTDVYLFCLAGGRIIFIPQNRIDFSTTKRRSSSECRNLGTGWRQSANIFKGWWARHSAIFSLPIWIVKQGIIVWIMVYPTGILVSEDPQFSFGCCKHHPPFGVCSTTVHFIGYKSINVVLAPHWSVQHHCTLYWAWINKGCWKWLHVQWKKNICFPSRSCLSCANGSFQPAFTLPPTHWVLQTGLN